MNEQKNSICFQTACSNPQVNDSIRFSLSSTLNDSPLAIFTKLRKLYNDERQMMRTQQKTQNIVPPKTQIQRQKQYNQAKGNDEVHQLALNYRMEIEKSRSYEQKIKIQQCQLLEYKKQLKKVKQQLCISHTATSQENKRYIKFLQDENRRNVDRYEKLLAKKIASLEKKEEEKNSLYLEKLELSNEHHRILQILYQQRRSLIEKNKEIQGLHRLVEQYQKDIQDYERRKIQSQMREKHMEEKIKQVEGYNRELLGDLDECDKLVKQKQQRLINLSKLVQQGREINTKYLNQIEILKNQCQENCRQFSSKRTSFEQLIADLSKKLALAVKQLGQNKLKQDQKAEKIEKLMKQVKDQKLKAIRIIKKVKIMYSEKNKLLKKMMKSKIDQIKGQFQILYQNISKSVFAFYQQTKTDIILSSFALTQQKQALQLDSKNTATQQEKLRKIFYAQT